MGGVINVFPPGSFIVSIRHLSQSVSNHRPGTILPFSPHWVHANMASSLHPRTLTSTTLPIIALMQVALNRTFQ